MKTILTLLILLPTILFSQEDQTFYIDYSFEFEEGSTQLMYGNNVVLRSQDDPTSKAMDTLRIGDPVKIIKKSETTTHINGKPWHWYKVKADKKTGYVLGGLIALDHKEINGNTYLLTTAERDSRMFARVRVMDKNKNYYGHEVEISSSTISIEVDHNQGLTNVQDMCILSFHAEACGMIGGKAYLFNNGERLFEAIRSENMSEAGLFWFSENVEFMGADYWEDNIAYFSRENGEYMDDSMDWTQAVINKIRITWTGTEFTPDVSKLTFEVEEGE